MALVFANLAAFYGAFALYGGAAAAFFLRRPAGAFLCARFGFCLNAAAVGARAARAGAAPLTNSYEFILLFALVSVFLFLALAGREKSLLPAGSILFSLVALLFLFVFLFSRGQITAAAPLPPALRSLWLVSHVLTAALAYGCFLAAAAFALLRLSRGAAKEDSAFGRRLYRIVFFGFAALSVSIALGAVWAEQAWGSYWTWDPKETWALITWIVYAIYLHLSRRRAWTEQTSCLAVCLGFLLVLFTFFGVNFLLPGLHSYA
ncbi:MAG: cytochrome c biogenesis protein CcsA [Gracilibacteraceae bacterium]|nr:cytochrome c biogenesis protein CcsA [Gracilibacteraceae bacterium]